MATLAPHLSRHANPIREKERFWLQVCRKTVRGNDRVPGHEEPHRLRGSTKSPKEQVGPRAGQDREVELISVNAYLETTLATGFMEQLSPVPAPIIFAKMDHGLWLCVGYQPLNQATVKSQYPGPLSPEKLDRTSRTLITSPESRKVTSTKPSYNTN